MTFKHRSICVGMTLSLAAAATTACAALVDDPFTAAIVAGATTVRLQTVATGLTAPNFLTQPGDGTDRLFVVDQVGKVELIANGVRSETPFLDVSSRLVPLGAFGPGTFDERGLLGLAFHPQFSVSGSNGFGKLYTYTSEPVAGAADFTTPVPVPAGMNHQSVIAEWTIDPGNPDRVNPASRREVMRIDEPQFNHNAGMLVFGPDDDLYIGLGDGGQGNDAGDGHNPAIGNGQDLNTVLGKILRIDVDGNNSVNGQYGIPTDNPFVGVDGVDEIYASGFRNPFRFSFDESGRLIVADVGQRKIEEVDIVEIGGNYGWFLKEGSFVFSDGSITDDPAPPGLIDPVLEYDHDEGISVIGGFVYNGSALPGLQGKYVFGDFSRAFSTADGRLFVGDLSTGGIEELKVLGLVSGGPGDSLGLFVKGFGQDADGEIYLLAGATGTPFGDQGSVFKLAPVPVPAAGWFFASGIASLFAYRRRAARVTRRPT